MRIEFHSDPRTGAVIAGHASNGAILGTGDNERQALSRVIESAEAALHEINGHEPLSPVEQEISDGLRDAAEKLRCTAVYAPPRDDRTIDMFGEG